MENDVIGKLTSKDDKSSCAYAAKIIAESNKDNFWYSRFDDFASLLNHPKSLVRNRALAILASIAKWDDGNKFEKITKEYLAHVTDEKPITSRTCIKSLSAIGLSKPNLIPEILKALKDADLSKYKDSMRPLIEKDIKETVEILQPQA